MTYWWAEFSQTTPLGGISVATCVLATWLQQVLFLSVFPRNGQHLDAVMLLVKRKIFACRLRMATYRDGVKRKGDKIGMGL